MELAQTHENVLHACYVSQPRMVPAHISQSELLQAEQAGLILIQQVPVSEHAHCHLPHRCQRFTSSAQRMQLTEQGVIHKRMLP